MNDEHKLNYVKLQNTASEQTVGDDLSMTSPSHLCCNGIYTPALSSMKSALKAAMILVSQVSVTVHAVD